MEGRMEHAPSELDFQAAFGVMPEEDSKPEDGYWAYIFEGPDTSRLQFSFNTHEGSTQIVYWVGDSKVITVVSDGAETITLQGDYIKVSFEGSQLTTLSVRVFPALSVEWTSLRD